MWRTYGRTDTVCENIWPPIRPWPGGSITKKNLRFSLCLILFCSLLLNLHFYTLTSSVTLYYNEKTSEFRLFTFPNSYLKAPWNKEKINQTKFIAISMDLFFYFSCSGKWEKEFFWNEIQDKTLSRIVERTFLSNCLEWSG